jgi:MFS family permease
MGEPAADGDEEGPGLEGSHLTTEDLEDALLDGDRPIRTGTARAALSHRTFRIVFLGAFASNIGSWMQNVVLGAYAYELTHSASYVGLIVFAQLGPSLLLAVLGGAAADAWDRRRLLIVVSVTQLVFSLGLAVLCRAPDPSKLGLFLLVLAIGMGQAVFGPTYSAVLPGLVGRRDLPGAISLNSAQMNASRVVGPALGGVAFHLVGPSWVFAANAVTYLFVIGALLAVRLPAPRVSEAPVRRMDQLLGGFAVARQDRVVGRSLLTVFVFSLLSLSFVGLMPVVAADNLGISPRSSAYGALYAVFGLGALAGALSIGTVLVRARKERIVRVGLVGYAVTLTVFALLRSPGPAYPVVAVLGACYFAMITSLSTAMQARLDDAVRGRVMALWIMGFGGTVSVGNLVAGPVAERVGITTVLIFGAVVALALAWFADLRPGDDRRGPVPEVPGPPCQNAERGIAPVPGGAGAPEGTTGEPGGRRCDG